MDTKIKAIQKYSLKTGQEKNDVSCTLQIIGKDVLVSVFGGERPHIGAVAIAHPRQNLRIGQKNTASSSVICMQDHKEDLLAKKMSEVLSTQLNATVVLAAGMHWSKISKEEIIIV